MLDFFLGLLVVWIVAAVHGLREWRVFASQFLVHVSHSLFFIERKMGEFNKTL